VTGIYLRATRSASLILAGQFTDEIVLKYSAGKDTADRVFMTPPLEQMSRTWSGACPLGV